MKAKDLIKLLQNFDGDQEVAIYNEPLCSALIIPSYDLELQVSIDSDFAKEYELPKDTIFITGK